MTSPWEVLGIEPTTDRRRIRSAYAARLKSTHPEDDPEGFQRLRQAYEIALAYASFAASVSEVPPIPLRPLELPPEPISHDPVAPLIERVQALYAGEHRRSEALWRELLSDESLWNLERRDRFQQELFGFVLEHRDLNYPIWRLLEEEFQWTILSRSLYARYDPDEVDRVLDEIHEAVGNDPAAPYQLEPLPEDARSPRFPWWGVPLLLMLFRGLTSLHQPDTADRSRPARDAMELLRHSQEEQASMLAEIEAARLDPALFENMEQHTLELAAEREVPEAQWELGRRYLRSDRVGRNDTLARIWLRRAAENGHERAARELERFYER